MFAILFLLTLVEGLCYTPDGTLSNDIPCNPGEPASICCTSGFLCMSNGLCQPAASFKQHSDQFIRGTCTDKTWAAPECRGFCVKENPSGGEWVMRCSNSSATALGLWCCAFDDCCDSGAKMLRLEDATVTATAQIGSRTTSTSDRDVSSTVRTSSGEGSSTPSPSHSEPGRTTTAASTSLKPSSEPPSTSSNTLAIGLGVGLGVGLVAALAALWIIWRKRRKTPPPTTSSEGMYDYGTAKPVPRTPGELDGGYEGHQLPEKTDYVELPGHDAHMPNQRSASQR